MTPKRSMLAADAALLGVALFWGMGYVAMKIALDSFTPLWLTVVRFVSAFALLAALFGPRLIRLSASALRAGLLAGGLLTLAFWVSTVGLQYTTAGKQAFIVTAYVVVVPFLLWVSSRRFPGFARCGRAASAPRDPCPMNQIRTFLLIAWLMVAFLLWQEWGKEKTAAAQPAPAIPAATQAGVPTAAIPQAAAGAASASPAAAPVAAPRMISISWGMACITGPSAPPVMAKPPNTMTTRMTMPIAAYIVTYPRD